MNRLDIYRYNKSDFILSEIEKSGFNVDDYYYNQGYIANAKINKKMYKVFQIRQPLDLKIGIEALEKDRIKKKTEEKYKKQGIDIEKSIGGWREVNKEISIEVEKIYNKIIIKNNIKELLEKQEYIDIAYFNGKYKIAPAPVGRPTETEKEVRINARLTEEQHIKLKNYAENKGMGVSEVLRYIIEYKI